MFQHCQLSWSRYEAMLYEIFNAVGPVASIRVCLGPRWASKSGTRSGFHQLWMEKYLQLQHEKKLKKPGLVGPFFSGIHRWWNMVEPAISIY